MESLDPEFALYDSKNKGSRTDTALFPISQICIRGVTLSDTYSYKKGQFPPRRLAFLSRDLLRRFVNEFTLCANEFLKRYFYRGAETET